MHKIPVIGTVARAYGFAIGNFVTVFRLSWFWALISAAALFYWGPEVMAAAIQFMKTQDVKQMEAVSQASNAISLVQTLASIVIIVALLRAVISQDFRPGVPVHLFSGMPDLRVLLVALLLFIAAIAAIFAFGIVFGILAGILTAIAPGAAGPAAGIVSALVALALLWVVLRLSLVVPVASVENTLGVERSWALMKGNTIRMFFAIVLTFAPLALAAGLIFGQIAGPFPVLDAADPKLASEAVQTWMLKAFETATSNWPLYVGVNFILTIFLAGLQCGLLGHAYRSATGMNETA
jgi:hypothetical protein